MTTLHVGVARRLGREAVGILSLEIKSVKNTIIRNQGDRVNEEW